MTNKKLIAVVALASAMQTIVLEKDNTPDPEQPPVPIKKHHGQPRSLKETRRAQRKGGRR